jgi:hypothetical protein
MNLKETVPEAREIKQVEEQKLTESIGTELTDEQLEQLAEGSCSWGANCNKGC